MLSEEIVKTKIAELQSSLSEIEAAFNEKVKGINEAQQTIQNLQQEATLLEKRAISVNGSLAALKSLIEEEAPPLALVEEQTDESA